MGAEKDELELVIEYLRGQLSPEDHSLMENRIAGDPVLREMVRVLSQLRDESDDNDWRKMKLPSHSLFDRLLKDFKLRRRDGSGKQGITIFDSQMLPLPEGVRSATVDTRRIKYLIGDAQLEISVYPVSPNSFEIIGQLAGREEGRPIEVILNGKKIKLNSCANQFNLFRFPRVPTGDYDMMILDQGNIIGQIKLEL